tara:strand:+ start:1534 stop:2037 length:504 start_codon:yes stop_codon:yes gene_type:complete
MGRLRKLRIEATERANKVLLEGKTEVKPAKTEESEQKTEDFGSLQDFYTLIESNRSNEETVTEEEEVITEGLEINGKKVDERSFQVDGIDYNDHPDYVDAYISAAKFEDGEKLSDIELDQLNDKHTDVVYDAVMNHLHEGNMKNVADKMKYILEYDTTKTRKENLNK